MNLPLIPTLVIVLFACALAASAAEPEKAAFPALDKLPVVKGLPDPFVFNDGTRMTKPDQWPRRRDELQAMILHYEYGELPPAPGNTVGVELVSGSAAVKGATRRVVKITCGPENKVTINLELTIPKGKGPFPAIICGDLGWGRVPDDITAEIIKRGYILADFNRTELAPDSKTGYKSTGLFVAYPDADCGAVAAWAWGFQRCVDFLETLDYVDKEKITVTGHSRGGKAAILAGATDPRVALTAPNCSGCGGSGCYKFQAPKSEDIAAITKNFPFWFAPGFTAFIGHIDRLPFDQHELKAICAPRAFFETEALGDLWANPEGSRQTYLAAREVYKFLGVPDKIGIVYREGKHEHNADDWNALLDFADQTFFNKKVTRDFNPNPFPNTPKTFEWTAPAQ